MKILFITHKFPPSVGGMEKQSYELISRFDESKIVLAHKGDESIIVFFLKLRSRVKKILKQHNDIEIIHLNDGLMAAAFTMLCPKVKVKTVATLHGLDVVFPLGIYQKYIFPKVALNIDKFICVSNATYNECVNRNIVKDKLKVVSNGVDVKRSIVNFDPINIDSTLRKYGISSTDSLIIGVGRPVRRKGFSWFAQNVLNILPNNYKYIHIGHIQDEKSNFLLPSSLHKKWQLFMGATSDASALKVLSLKPEYKDRLILAGRVSDEERDILISQARVVIMPNIYDPGDMEGFGLVALEAAIYGKVVLVSAIEGLTDAIHDGKNGYHVASGNVSAWQNAIVKYCEKNTLYDERIRQYTIDNYSWQIMVNGYRDVFADLVK
jgi:glycosyltransferase involved in cell wall biosynthesis